MVKIPNVARNWSVDILQFYRTVREITKDNYVTTKSKQYLAKAATRQPRDIPLAQAAALLWQLPQAAHSSQQDLASLAGCDLASHCQHL